MWIRNYREPQFHWSLWGHYIEGWRKLQDSCLSLKNRLFSFNSLSLVSQSETFSLELSIAIFESQILKLDFENGFIES